MVAPRAIILYYIFCFKIKYRAEEKWMWCEMNRQSQRNISPVSLSNTYIEQNRNWNTFLFPHLFPRIFDFPYRKIFFLCSLQTFRKIWQIQWDMLLWIYYIFSCFQWKKNKLNKQKTCVEPFHPGQHAFNILILLFTLAFICQHQIQIIYSQAVQ